MNLGGPSRSLHGWLLAGPFVLTLFVFFLFALARVVYFSFTDYDLFHDANWVGVENFVAVVGDNQFVAAFVNTITFSVVVTVLQTLLALALAVIVGGDFWGKRAFRVTFYIPAILSSAAITLIFIWFYQENGFLNGFLSFVASNRIIFLTFAGISITLLIAWHLVDALRGTSTRFPDPVAALFAVGLGLAITLILSRTGILTTAPVDIQINWLGTHERFGPMPRTMWAIAIQNIYTTVPVFMLLFIAGIQGIPKDLYEAARIDGAGPWQQFVHVTVPQLVPVTSVVVTLGMIGTLQMFDQVALLGDTSPLESRITLAYYIYHNAFPPGSTPAVGLASAGALVLAAITLAIVYLQKLLGVRESTND